MNQPNPVTDLNSNLQLDHSEKAQLAANNISPSLSPHSLNAMSSSISSSTSSSRSVADSGIQFFFI